MPATFLLVAGTTPRLRNHRRRITGGAAHISSTRARTTLNGRARERGLRPSFRRGLKRLDALPLEPLR